MLHFLLYIYTVSKILALSFDKIFAFYRLAVEYDISKCRYPVTEEYAARVLAKRYINIYVTVAEDEAVDR